MSFRTTKKFDPPFRLLPYIDEINNYKIVLDLNIETCFPKEIIASNVLVKIQIQKYVSSATPELKKVCID